MDGIRFDRVTRALTSSVTRRRALAGLFGLAAASAGGDVSAAVRGRPCQRLGVQCTRDGQCCSGICRTESLPGRRRRQVCGCPSGLHACRGQCVNLLTDPTNCGACGEVCDSGECVDGACRAAELLGCPGVTCTPEAGWDGCYVSNETCLPEQTCFHFGDVEPLPCETHADCGASSTDCGLPGFDCVCVTGYVLTALGPDWLPRESPTCGIKVAQQGGQCAK